MMYSQIISHLYNTPTDQLNLDLLIKLKKDLASEYKLSKLPSNASIMVEYQRMLHSGQIQARPDVVKLLTKRWVRSQSGIVPVQVLTKPFWCPGKCIFCPNDFTMPKSYINTEPGAQRALMNNFDPLKQVYNRLLSLTMTWHPVDKIEMIVLWGTRDVYPHDYKISFIKWLYDACNTFDHFLNIYNSGVVTKDFRKFQINDLNISYPTDIQESININQTSACRIIWLTVETRPEYVTDENCIFRREIGITRVEMWIQSMFDDVLDANKRWHSIEQVREAMHRLRSYAFKISCHFMPWLYKSTKQKDIETFRLAYEDIYIKADEIKFYPTSVIPNTELFDLYMSGDYKPLELADNKEIIETVLTNYIPPYTRIKRLIRDIPSEEVAAWSSVTNLRQLVEDELMNIYISDQSKREDRYIYLWDNLTSCATEDDFLSYDMKSKNISDIHTYIIWSSTDISSVRNFVSLDTRSREITHAPKWYQSANIITVIRKYISSNGVELFLSIEDDLWYLYGFGRLCLPDEWWIADYEWLWSDTAMIRELHVYGQLTKVWTDSEDGVQHTGIGKYILSLAEKISQNSWYHRLSVISGIWVREYYAKNGYILTWTYMTKLFS